MSDADTSHSAIGNGVGAAETEIFDVIEDLQERVAALEAENERLRDELEEERKARSQADADVRLTLQEEFDDRLEAEQQTRSKRDTHLERKIGMIAEECDVELSATRVEGEDKITRVLRYGPGDIVPRVYPVHERARDLLANIGEWGSLVDDKLGRRFTITAPEARQRFKDKRDEDLPSKQIKDVFLKVEKWASETRQASVTKTDDGVTKLALYIDQEDV